MPATRCRFVLPGLLAAALVGGALSQGVAIAAPAAAVPAAGSGTVFGSAVQGQPQEKLGATIARIEKVDGHLGVVRRFQDTPDNSVFTALADRSGIISFRLPPDRVLAGAYDAQFRSFFAAAPTDHTTWWSYFHEADIAHQSGALKDLGQYRDAYRHIAMIAEASGNSQLKNTVILFFYSANPKSGVDITDYWPGADLTDAFSFDNYNGWATQQGTYGDPSEVMRTEKAAAARVGKPWAIAEFGSVVVGNNYAGRAAWITKFSQFAASNGALFASYFDINPSAGASKYRLLDAPSQKAYHAVVSDQNPY